MFCYRAAEDLKKKHIFLSQTTKEEDAAGLCVFFFFWRVFSFKTLLCPMNLSRHLHFLLEVTL